MVLLLGTSSEAVENRHEFFAARRQSVLFLQVLVLFELACAVGHPEIAKDSAVAIEAAIDYVLKGREDEYRNLDLGFFLFVVRILKYRSDCAVQSREILRFVQLLRKKQNLSEVFRRRESEVGDLRCPLEEIV